LPSGKFGKTAPLEAGLWNFHPFALTFMDDFLTDWKNNSKYDELRIFGFGPNSQIVLQFWRIVPNLEMAGIINLALKARGIFC
jgi:hypothetical protein